MQLAMQETSIGRRWQNDGNMNTPIVVQMKNNTRIEKNGNFQWNNHFATVNKEHLQELVRNKDSCNIRQSMDTSFKIFREFLKSKGLLLTAKILRKNGLLRCLNTELCWSRIWRWNAIENKKPNKTWEQVSKDTQRTLGKNVFSEANLTFTANQAELKRDGFGDATHCNSIDENDAAKLYAPGMSGVLDENTPARLQNKLVEIYIVDNLEL